jgi:aromatic-L-amino-acid decarboxylase
MNISEFRETGHNLVDLLSDYLNEIEEHPLLKDTEPKVIEKLFNEPLPEEGMSSEDIINELKKKLFPYTTNVNHPGYFGLITPTPTPIGILGDFIASALNQNIGAYSVGPSAVQMEKRTVRWLCDLVGFPESAGGNLTSGGMMANFIGMKLARDWVSDNNAQHQGAIFKHVVYTSEERHVSIDKAVDAVGFGRNSLRIIPTDKNFSIDPDALERAIKEDKMNNLVPACIIGLAGTTNTGSVDPLPVLRDIADKYKMWLHIDAAYGGGTLLSEKRINLLNGIESADSVTLDPHKWFYAPLDAGSILVKDKRQLTLSFGIQPSYLIDNIDNERFQYFVHSFEQSRRFRSLKVWMSFKRYGTKQISRWIDSNIDQAQHLYKLCKDEGVLEPAVYPEMSAICIRFKSDKLSTAELELLHNEVAKKAELSGKFWISTTNLKGKLFFRINPVNFRTKLKHIDELYNFLKKECYELEEKLMKSSERN